MSDIELFTNWFIKDTGIKYQVISVIESNVFIRDGQDNIYYEDIDIFKRDFQEFKEVSDG